MSLFDRRVRLLCLALAVFAVGPASVAIGRPVAAFVAAASATEPVQSAASSQAAPSLRQARIRIRAHVPSTQRPPSVELDVRLALYLSHCALLI